MSIESEFSQLLLRVRDGDSDAAFELVRRYESAIRVAVRTRMSDPALRRQLDSMDICQSVMASFFLRAAVGEYDLREPAQLVALLTKMAQNKLAMYTRGQYRQRRDIRRAASGSDALPNESSRNPGPDHDVSMRELLDQTYEMMSAEIREIAAHRIRGIGWSEIASELGGTADSRRKQFQRAVDKIALALGVD